MMKLDQLRAGASIAGFHRNRIVDVFDAKRRGDCVEIHYARPDGRLTSKLITADQAKDFHQAIDNPNFRRLQIDQLEELFANTDDDITTMLSIWRTLQGRRDSSRNSNLRQQVEKRIFILLPKPVAVVQQLRDLSNESLRNRWEVAVRMLADRKQSARHNEFEDMLRRIGDEWARREHAARKGLFAWPSTEAPKGRGGLDGFDAPELGILRHLGYQTGTGGIRDDGHRQIMLDRIYESALPPLNNSDYMNSWGDKATPKRLEKMAESLAAFARNAKRNPNGSRLAIDHWERDLQHLHDRHYLPMRGRFVWPRAD